MHVDLFLIFAFQLGLLLSKSGIFVKQNSEFVPAADISTAGDDVASAYYLKCCRDCLATVRETKQTARESKNHCFYPPVNAIANGNWLGVLPKEYEEFTRTDEQAIALYQANIYLATIVGSRKAINSNSYILDIGTPIIQHLGIPNDVTSTIRMTLVGAFTPIAKAQVRQLYIII